MNRILLVLLLPMLLIVSSCDNNEAVFCPEGGYGCDNVCGSTTVIDDCGICGGENASMDCAGVCDGNAILDECGECNGNGPEEFFDCDGNCIVDLDCNGDCSDAIEDCLGVCGGDAVVDCNGECGGDAIEDCNGECGGDAILDCEGVCDGNAVIDECGECNGDGLSCLSSCDDCTNLLGSWTGVTEDYDFINEQNCPYSDFTGQDASGRSFEFINDCSYDWEYFYPDENAFGSGTYYCNDNLLAQLCDDTTGCINITYETIQCSESDFCIEAHWTQTENGCEYSVSLILAKDCEGTEDCLGVCGGDAVVDCNGVCGGDAVVDECGVCDGDGIAVGACDCDGNILDCAGECGGTALLDQCGTCDSDTGNDCIQDCAGQWGGSAVVDSCGICDDDSTNDCTFDILYSSSTDIYGFQFNLDGITILSASGGAAGDAGFNLSSGASTVLGFGLNGTEFVPAGNGVLVTLELAPGSLNPCMSNIVVSDINAESPDVSNSECLNIIIE